MLIWGYRDASASTSRYVGKVVVERSPGEGAHKHHAGLSTAEPEGQCDFHASFSPLSSVARRSVSTSRGEVRRGEARQGEAREARAGGRAGGRETVMSCAGPSAPRAAAANLSARLWLVHVRAWNSCVLRVSVHVCECVRDVAWCCVT